jgi:hypothetical protein
MQTMLSLLFVMAAASQVALAQTAPSVPEINPATAVTALTLLGGGLLVLRSKFRK